jgi:hypothetical protein
VSTFSRKVRIVGMVVFGIGLVGFVFSRMNLDVRPQAPSNSAGNINGSNGIVTQGQSGNNTIIQAPQPRQLGEAQKVQLLARIPKSRKIRLMFESSESDAGPLADQIADFLKSNGYSVEGPHPAIIVPAPRGVAVQLSEDHPENPINISVGVR